MAIGNEHTRDYQTFPIELTETMDDVEMKDVASLDTQVVQQIENSYSILTKASVGYDNRYVSSLFRDLPSLRKQLQQVDVLGTVISRLGIRPELLELFPVDKKLDLPPPQVTISPEIELYLMILIQINLLDNSRLPELTKFNQYVIKFLNCYNKRSLDLLEAKSWFYTARTAELTGDLSIRKDLLYALRTATLRHDSETQAMTITLLLRSYLSTHDIQQAVNLVEKIEFPQNVGNSLIARYYYYLARINAIQLDYSTSHEYVIAAIRKAPQTTKANGFIQAATKLRIIIELLMGDIPELNTFTANLTPYFNLTKSVRLGDLKYFSTVLSDHQANFIKDSNFTLISRLRQNVIKTGIRIISLSYSKISLKDICIKLHLDTEESTEYIVSKAIRDGVIEASINHERGFMQSKELLDIYSTKLPQNEFDQRIKFCLSLHNDSVKSMRYPTDDDKNQDAHEKEELVNDEIDLLKAIEEGDLDDFMD